jgi:hypothetical protein
MRNIFYLFSFVFFILINLFSEIKAQASFNSGTMGVSVNAYGRLSIFLPDNSGPRQIERLSVLAGTSAASVFDFHNDAGLLDTTKIISDSLKADYIIYGAYDNSYSNLPPALEQRLYVYGWNNNSYIIIKNVIINKETSPLNLKTGLDIISQINGNYGFDTVQYLVNQKVIDLYKNSQHIGIKFLSHEIVSLFSFDWYAGYMKDSSYWLWLNHPLIDSFYFSGTDGPVVIPSIQTINLNPGDSIVIFCALAAGSGITEMLSNMNRAEIKYDVLTNAEKNYGKIISGYYLKQNYPNPFNPATKIQFHIPVREFVVIKIYNSLGEQITQLIDKEFEAGIHEVDFNSGNLPSGVYYYTISAGKFRSAKKMIIVK